MVREVGSYSARKAHHLFIGHKMFCSAVQSFRLREPICFLFLLYLNSRV